jgi:hypothetical protein
METCSISIRIPARLLLYTLLISLSASATSQSLSRDVYNTILVNHAGYTTTGHKFCIVKGKSDRTFQIIEITSGKAVSNGILRAQPGDFGEYLVADFSDLRREGHYYILSDSLRSYPFVINKAPYQKAMDLIVGYFALQRCGPSTTGYLSPCHLDDGKRADDGKHQDVVGGWHDASDLRKWVGATIYGMIGLAKAYEFEGDKQKKEAILEELLWGNQYFLKMQEPSGFVMSFIGGEIEQAGDNNRWTDNQVAPEGGELALKEPAAGESNGRMMVFGNSDDRIIQTDPVDLLSQYNFITAQALMARITKPADKNYAKKCVQAAVRCFEWSGKSEAERLPGVLGAAIQASLELYKATGEDAYKQYAVQQASTLNQLQAEPVVAGADTLGGYFYTSVNTKVPYKNIWNGCLELISLCDLLTAFPSHQDAASWKSMIDHYTHHYLTVMAKRNSFDIIPFGFYTEEDPGGDRKIGTYWYRYFMVPENWWVGINANIASMGIGLLKASRILKDEQLAALAQRQLDWIIGSNPFSSSTIVGVGYNQPKPFINGNEFRPATPLLPGGVMNGLGGDLHDQPAIGDGIYHVSEYWTPMVAYTLWLMTELSDED